MGAETPNCRSRGIKMSWGSCQRWDRQGKITGKIIFSLFLILQKAVKFNQVSQFHHKSDQYTLELYFTTKFYH